MLAGWVGEISVHAVGDQRDKFILITKVRLSQSVTAPHLHTWISATKDGNVLASRCTCMVGLGEACSHISALLFAAETHNRLHRDASCTSQLCTWLPRSMQNVRFAPISDINFTAPATKRNNITNNNLGSNKRKEFSVSPPSQAEISDFPHVLSKTGKPALLSIIPEYSDAYLLDYKLLSSPLLALFEAECMGLPYDDLLQKCEAAL